MRELATSIIELLSLLVLALAAGVSVVNPELGLALAASGGVLLVESAVVTWLARRSGAE